MNTRAFSAVITVDGHTIVAAGCPPFMVAPAAEQRPEWTPLWMVTGRDGDNCVAFKDGLRAIFGSDDAAIVLCEELNARAAR